MRQPGCILTSVARALHACTAAMPALGDACFEALRSWQ